MSVRESLSSTFQRFGSYLALVLRFIGYILGAYQRFTLDNSMTKKLYNFVENEKDDAQSDPNVPHSNNEFRQNLNHEISKRNPFKYKMGRFMCKKNFDSPWCLCCRHKSNREDKLQAKARTRLYAELDILNIIQKLRVARFVAEQNLSEEQRYLVNFHSEYMLTTDESQLTELNASRYLDHRKEEDDTRDRRARIADNVGDAINHLDATEHAATYKAIMGRGKDKEEAHAIVGEDDHRSQRLSPNPTARYSALVDNENNNGQSLLLRSD